jgi:hypothetical protein
MLVVSVARRLGSGNSFARLLRCPLKPSGAEKRRSESAKLTVPKRLLADAMLDNAALKELLGKKMVTPAAGREAVAYLRGEFAMSERRACRVVAVDRSSVRYRHRRRDDDQLRERLKALPPTLRDAWSRSSAVANLFRRIQIFLAEMPDSAPTYKRECNVRRTQTGGIRRRPGDVAVARLGVTRSGTWVYSAATPVTGFSALCRLRDQSYVVGSTQDSSVTALMRRVRTDVEAALSSDNSRGMRP